MITALAMVSFITIIGDSIQHASLETDHSVNYTTTPAQLFLQDGYAVQNISLGGQTMHAANAYDVSGAVAYTTPASDSKVVITLGHNDWVWGVSTPAEFAVNYQQLIYKISTSHVTDNNWDIYCVVPTARMGEWIAINGYYLADFREAVRNVASSGACTLVEADLWFPPQWIADPNLMPDGLHPSPALHAWYYMFLRQAIGE